MKKHNLAVKMLIALVLGLICGLIAILVRDNLPDVWPTIDRLLFADITAKGNESAIGLFYLVGQLFIRALQVVIIPMVFTSITLAMIKINDARKLGRIATKTLLIFFLTSSIALLFSGIIGLTLANLGAFGDFSAAGLNASSGTTAQNPLLIVLNAVPSNIISAFSNNGSVLAIVVLALGVGLAINSLNEKVTVLTKICQEISDIITVVLMFIVNKFGPIAIFALITRTFAAYGVEYLKPALAYMIIVTIVLLVYLFLGYATYFKVLTKLSPRQFVRKISKVALFGFSTSSSAATLPLNRSTTINELGADEDITSFVLPLGMTVNMDGTAIMQVIAAIFIATVGGYEISAYSLLVIMILALLASIGTPAAPGAGAVVLFTILSGMGYNNELALMAYTLILAINRPIEMLVTSLNCVGDSLTSLAVSKSEGVLDTNKYFDKTL